MAGSPFLASVLRWVAWIVLSKRGETRDTEMIVGKEGIYPHGSSGTEAQHGAQRGATREKQGQGTRVAQSLDLGVLQERPAE